MDTTFPTTSSVAVGDVDLVYDQGKLSVSIAGEHFQPGARFLRNLAKMTGVKPEGFRRLAAASPVNLARVLSHDGVNELHLTTLNGHLVTASAKALPQIDGETLFHGLTDFGITILNDNGMQNGMIQGFKVSDQSIWIGEEEYKTGMSVDIDLAGQVAPMVSHYFQRVVCWNGQRITAFEGTRRIALHSTTNAVDNATDVIEHLHCWRSDSQVGRISPRIEIASKTPASLGEVMALMNQVLAKDNSTETPTQQAASANYVKELAAPVFDRMLGDLAQRYGVASVKEIPPAKRRLLQTETSVGGLINLATEISTHHTDSREYRDSLSAWWDRLLSRPFHLEGVAQTIAPAPALWLEASTNAQMNLN